jgi:phage N-6-adenine-methyltransferase
MSNRKNPIQEQVSDNIAWETPPELFRQLNAYFHFELDAAASPENAKCARFWTENDNALIQPWAKSTFLNPPYGDQIPAWMRKAKREAQLGNSIVCLIPCRTDTEWFFDSIWYDADIIIFIHGRLQFGDEGVKAGSAKFPSAIVVYNLPLDASARVQFVNKFFRLGRVVFLKQDRQ